MIHAQKNDIPSLEKNINTEASDLEQAGVASNAAIVQGTYAIDALIM